MALNEQELHALAHLRLDRAITQVYSEMNEELATAPVGTVIDSTDRFNPTTHPELHDGVGPCFNAEEGLLGVVMEKISDTEARLTSTLHGASSVMTFAKSRYDLAVMLDDMDMQLAMVALMQDLDAEEVR